MQLESEPTPTDLNRLHRTNIFDTRSSCKTGLDLDTLSNCCHDPSEFLRFAAEDYWQARATLLPLRDTAAALAANANADTRRRGRSLVDAIDYLGRDGGAPPTWPAQDAWLRWAAPAEAATLDPFHDDWPYWPKTPQRP